MNDRIFRLMEKIPEFENEIKVDAVLICSPKNRFYLSGFKSSEGVILATKNEAYLLVDFRYYESAISTAKGFEVVLSNDFMSDIGEIIEKHNLKKVLAEREELTVAYSDRLESTVKNHNAKFVKSKALDEAICALKLIKSTDEIRKIKVAQEIAEQAFNFILPQIKVGKSEKKLALDLEFFMRNEGAEAVAFDMIVLSGKNGSLPHGEPSNKLIEPGDFVTIDMGAVYEGYCSDMTRTVAVGEVGDEQKNVYDVVLKAQTEALKALHAGEKCRDIDKTARDIIENAGFGEYFGHALGHGVGTNVHESPRLSAKSNDVLKPGMVVTVEPGIYIPEKFGVRIEDMVLVHELGCENLTSITKDLIII